MARNCIPDDRRSCVQPSCTSASGVRVPVRTRFRFGPEFTRAVQIRGLTLTAVARGAGIALATASAAARGDPVNVATALKLSRAVAAAPVVPELDAWMRIPGSEATHKLDPSGHSPSAANA
jgi:hypothetical protein